MSKAVEQVRSIAKKFTGKTDASFEHAVVRANGWFEELESTVFGPICKREFGDVANGPIFKCHTHSTLQELAEVERQLGFDLPPSYRQFLNDIGGLTFMNHWWDETTAVSKLVSGSTEWRREVIARHGSVPLLSAAGPLELIRFADHRNHTAEWIYICNYRDANNEAPIFRWYHDDAFGDASDLDWVKSVVASGFAESARPESDSFKEVRTPLVIELTDILGRDVTQREKLGVLRASISQLEKTSGDENVTVLHLIKKAVKSKKLIQQRDQLIADLRLDGQVGTSPLPKLDRTSAPKVLLFSTFQEWVSNEVDEMIEYVTGVLTESAN